jgi:MSHA biogenesis protein MshK
MRGLLLAFCLAAGPALAQLQDPTRPPPEAMAAPGGETAAVPAELKQPRLESVLVGRAHAGREIAVIDGKIVRRGESFNGAVLVQVDTNQAVLRRGGKDQVLYLFPPTIEGKRAAARR